MSTTTPLYGTITTALYVNKANHVFELADRMENPNFVFNYLIPQGSIYEVVKVNAGEREHLVILGKDKRMLIPSEFIKLD